MKQNFSATLTAVSLSVVFALAAGLAVAPAAHAQKPEWAGQGGGKGNGGGGKDGGKEEVRPSKAPAGSGDLRVGDTRISIQIGSYFDARQRRSALDYYRPVFGSGQCPPGLAKKNNGCMPPGQAKQWARGRALLGRRCCVACLSISASLFRIPRELPVTARSGGLSRLLKNYLRCHRGVKNRLTAEG